MRENDVDAAISVADWPSFSARVRASEYQIALLGWFNIVDPDWLTLALFRSGGTLNWGGYSNAEVDKLPETGRASIDFADLTKTCKEAARIIVDDLSYYVIAYQG